MLQKSEASKSEKLRARHSMKKGTSPSTFVIFVRRLSFFGILLTIVAMLYTLFGGDPQYLVGTQNTDHNTSSDDTSQIADASENVDVTQYQTAKPTMSDTILHTVSDGSTSSSSGENDTYSDTNPDYDYDYNYGSQDGSNTNLYENPSDNDTSSDLASNMEQSPMTPSVSPTDTSPSTPEVTPMSTTPSGENMSNSSHSKGTTTSDLPPSSPPLSDTSIERSSEATTAPLLRSDTSVLGPDGVPRMGEVLIREEGMIPPLKNLEGPPVSDFLEIFNFDITPDWVEARWENITVVGPLTTRGYRVPLSTGPTKSDLVGSLTYYFNRHLELEKITFDGFTGDLDRLVISLQYFNMSKRVTSDPNALLYLSESLSDNRYSYLKSYYRLTPVDSENPIKKYWITMELYPPER